MGFKILHFTNCKNSNSERVDIYNEFSSHLETMCKIQRAHQRYEIIKTLEKIPYKTESKINNTWFGKVLGNTPWR